MPEIILEQRVERGGNAQPTFPGTTFYSYQRISKVYNTDTRLFAEKIEEFYVMDEREVEYDASHPYFIDPAENFYQQTLANGNIEHFSYDGYRVTTEIEIVNNEQDCTLAIIGVTVQKASWDGTDDGIATINTSGAQGSLLYSLDNINW